MSNVISRYRKLRGDLERFIVEVEALAREAEEIANDPARTTRNRDMATGAAAAYYAGSNDVLRILSRFPSSDDD